MSMVMMPEMLINSFLRGYKFGKPRHHTYLRNAQMADRPVQREILACAGGGQQVFYLLRIIFQQQRQDPTKIFQDGLKGSPGGWG